MMRERKQGDTTLEVTMKMNIIHENGAIKPGCNQGHECITLPQCKSRTRKPNHQGVSGKSGRTLPMRIPGDSPFDLAIEAIGCLDEQILE